MAVRQTRPDVKKVLKVSKDGSKTQVQFQNGKLGWLPTAELEGWSPAEKSAEGAKERTQPEPQVTVPIRNLPVNKPAQVQEKQGLKMPPLPKIRLKRGLLTDTEADQLREDYAHAMDEIFILQDKLISHTLKGHPKVQIWSDIDDADTYILVDFMLTMGKSNERVAVFVRASVTFYKQARIAEILLPRFWKTWEAYNFFGFEMPGNRQFRQKVRQANANGRAG